MLMMSETSTGKREHLMFPLFLQQLLCSEARGEAALWSILRISALGAERAAEQRGGQSERPMALTEEPL